MGKFIDMAGQRIGYLTVLRRSGNVAGTRSAVVWLCRCDCGKEWTVKGQYIREGRTNGCGCQKNGRLTHGKAGSRVYTAWHGMRGRCARENSEDFRSYGARGIRVCARWQKFENFLEDMGEPPEGRSLDRIDNDGWYSKSNCRWATPEQQANNKRTSIRVQTSRGLLTLQEAADIAGVKHETMRKRRESGVSGDALLAPKFSRLKR